MQYDSIYIAALKRQNDRNEEQSSSCQRLRPGVGLSGVGEQVHKSGSTRHLSDGSILHLTLMMDTQMYTCDSVVKN